MTADYFSVIIRTQFSMS